MTLKNLLAQQIDSISAKKIIEQGYNKTSLAEASDEELLHLNINPDVKQKILTGKRPAISPEIINNLLYKSKMTCCICRDPDRAIIIHHIEAWEKSKSNEENNLVVLCLLHHGEAHTTRELAQNLTPEKIRLAKVQWETEVAKFDREILEIGYKELSVTTKKLSELKSKWYNFFMNISAKVEKITDFSENLKFDFIINGEAILYAKVLDVEHIDNVINKDKLVQYASEGRFLDSVIILASKPFISKNGFYANEDVIQLGWIYNFGGGEWDHILLKFDYNISNGKFFIQNLLEKESKDYKNFMSTDNFDEVMATWQGLENHI